MSLDENVAKNFICSLCNHPFEDPRSLPCQHSFCLHCLRSLADNAQQKCQPSSSPTKKIKIACAKCGTAFVVPSKGVESFPKDTRISKMREDAINKLAEDISRKIRSSENLKTEGHERIAGFGSTGHLSNHSFSGYDAKREGKYSRFGNMDKYSKYFEDDANDGTRYKPTIRPDHTRLGYENSVRFRHRRSCGGDRSTDRHSYADDDRSRSTWTEQRARRAYSLNRQTMDSANNFAFAASRDNLSGITEIDSPMSPTRNLASPTNQADKEDGARADRKFEDTRGRYSSKMADRVGTGFESIKEGLLAGREGLLSKKRADISKGRKPMSTYHDNKSGNDYNRDKYNNTKEAREKEFAFDHKFAINKERPTSPKGPIKITEKVKPKTLRKKSKSPLNRPASPASKTKTSVRRLSQSPKRPGSRKSDGSPTTPLNKNLDEAGTFHAKFNKQDFDSSRNKSNLEEQQSYFDAQFSPRESYATSTPKKKKVPTATLR